jgi:hypothetical protein
VTGSDGAGVSVVGEGATVVGGGVVFVGGGVVWGGRVVGGLVLWGGVRSGGVVWASVRVEPATASGPVGVAAQAGAVTSSPTIPVAVVITASAQRAGRRLFMMPPVVTYIRLNVCVMQ